MAVRPYDAIRKMVERLNGTMVYQREGYRYGAWIVRINERVLVAEATGNRSFPDLDGLHVPKNAIPRHWDDYSTELLPAAEELLMRLLR